MCGIFTDERVKEYAFIDKPVVYSSGVQTHTSKQAQSHQIASISIINTHTTHTTWLLLTNSYHLFQYLYAICKNWNDAMDNLMQDNNFTSQFRFINFERRYKNHSARNLYYVNKNISYCCENNPTTVVTHHQAILCNILINSLNACCYPF